MSDHSEYSTRDVVRAFSDPQAVAHYAEGTPRNVPGLDVLHRMTEILLAERAPADARILVLGAGGGLELKAFAQAQSRWTFVGVDPSKEMLQLASHTLGPHTARAELIQGYIDDAPAGPFDAATCLLTFHFLEPAERRRTAREILRRLKPGAPFVAAHMSFPQAEEQRSLWLSRHAAYATGSSVNPDQANKGRAAARAILPTLSPETDEAILRDAGFTDVSLFFAALTFRGWICHAG